MIFVYVVTPLLDGIVALILAGLEAIKGRINIDLVNSSVKIQKLKDSLQEDDVKPLGPIGFKPPEEDEEVKDD